MILVGQLSLTWHLPCSRYHARPLARSSLVALCATGKGTCIGFVPCGCMVRRRRRSRISRTAAVNPWLSCLSGADCSLYLLPETIEVPSQLGELLIVLVLPRLFFPDSLPQLAEPRLDPSQRQRVGLSTGQAALALGDLVHLRERFAFATVPPAS